MKYDTTPRRRWFTCFSVVDQLEFTMLQTTNTLLIETKNFDLG
jgi:hypothetical protein